MEVLGAKGSTQELGRVQVQPLVIVAYRSFAERRPERCVEVIQAVAEAPPRWRSGNRLKPPTFLIEVMGDPVHCPHISD